MSAPKGIRAEQMSRFFAERVPGGDGPLEFSLISGGRSNLTYRVDCGDRRWALRRPPLGHVLPTAHDMAREFRVLSGLADTDVPSPRPVALCEDPGDGERPYYVMEYRPGVVLHDRLPADYAPSEQERRRIAEALVDTLVRIHAVDYAAVGLADLGRPEGYLERQLQRWSKQWQGNKTADLPEIDELLKRLERALPRRSDASIVHGDYRLGNLALDPVDAGRVLAVFDWEMATLGDPLADLGYTLACWCEAADAAPISDRFPSFTALPGFPARAELTEAYAKGSGRDVASVDFYSVLAITKLAIIGEGIYKRYRRGKMLLENSGRITRETDELAARALVIAEASSDRALRS